MSKIEVIKVNKGVPIPDHYERYPFDQLDIGDNFEFSAKKKMSVQSRVSRLNKAGVRQYITRKINDEVYGVWRVEDKITKE